MRFLSFISYQLRSQLLRWRWLLPFPLFFFLIYRTHHYLQYLLATGSLVNWWDMLLVVTGNFQYLYFGIALLFVYLASDLLPESNNSQLIVLRLRSRTKWWLGKLLTLAILTAIYLLALHLLVGGAAAFTLPIEPGFSPQAQQNPASVNLDISGSPNASTASVSPALYLLKNAALMFMGFVAFGLLMMVIDQLTRKYYYGLLTGIIVLFGSMTGLMLSGPPAWAKWFPGWHLSIINVMPVRSIPISQSFAYWGVLIIALYLIGAHISRRQDLSAAQD